MKYDVNFALKMVKDLVMIGQDNNFELECDGLLQFIIESSHSQMALDVERDSYNDIKYRYDNQVARL